MIMEDTSFAILQKDLSDSWRMSATFWKCCKVQTIFFFVPKDDKCIEVIKQLKFVFVIWPAEIERRKKIIQLTLRSWEPNVRHMS